MKSTLRIALKPNEKIYVNGAVISVDRKVSIEFLNDVQFLLQSHVLQAADATTPLRQLYFVVQMMLITPGSAQEARDMFRTSLPVLLETFRDETIRAALKDVDRLVFEGRPYDALRAIRGLFSIEATILNPVKDHQAVPREAAE